MREDNIPFFIQNPAWSQNEGRGALPPLVNMGINQFSLAAEISPTVCH